VGGGHAHLSVLRALAQRRSSMDVVLITPSPQQTYSGMLPGWLSGNYSLSDCQIDLGPLAQLAGVKVVIDQVVGMDANRRCVLLSDMTRLDYDLLSLDVGSETDISWLTALGDRLLPVKPIDEFTKRWPSIIEQVAKKKSYHLAVVGAGAAGVEIAFAAQHVFSEGAYKAGVSLVSSENGILPGHSPGVVKRVRKLLSKRGIQLHEAYAVGVEHGLLLGNGQLLPADIVIAATGSSSPCWLETSQLALNEQGYISVDATHRSISHPDVFAAGDVCARTDFIMPRSGVHAVFAGPVLAHNLIASIRSEKFIRYRPRKRSLYILATGPKHAIASWGAFSAQGYWVWRWKNWIDRRFIKKNSVLLDAQKESQNDRLIQNRDVSGYSD